METIVQICEHNRIKIYVRMLTNVCVLDTHTHTHTHINDTSIFTIMYIQTHSQTQTHDTSIFMFFGFLDWRVCVARTCSTSEVPMPNASAPKAPCVAVWLSPHTTVVPGRVKPWEEIKTNPQKSVEGGSYIIVVKALLPYKGAIAI